MATTIGLGVQFTANANGMTKGLSEADRAIKNLAQQASSAARLFDTFASSSAAAAQTQQQVATDVAFLGSAFRTGQISAEQYAAELRGIVASANGAAQAFAEGAQVTERVATAEEKRAATLGRLAQLLEQGAISQQTYERAAADASGANAEAAKAESARAQALARAAQITQANLSPAQKYDQEVQELNQHLQAGRISQETYNTALQKAAQQFAKAEVAAAQYDAAADNAGTGNVLAFNELSGILSAIPGPLGNVAGRISGLSSAAEGLGRVFAGGVSQGFGALATSAAGLVNPMTLAVGGIAAFGAGAVAVASGLASLEDRVEQLGNLADQLGVSFEFIQVLEESANRSGVSVESLAGAMTRLQKTLAGADEESKSAQAALAKLGVGIDELNGLSQEDQIRLIGDRIAAIEDPAQRTAAALALFGKSGAALLPFFKNLGPAAADIERLGGALSEIDRKRIDDFGAGIDALGVATARLGELLLIPFVGLGEGVSQAAADFLGGINRIADAVGDILAPEMNTLGNLFQAVGKAATLSADIIAAAFRVVQVVLEPLGGGILPAIGAGIAYINRQILIGAVANLAKFFSSAAAAAVAYATSAGTASIATAALGVSIRAAINSTGVGILVTGFGLAAGALLEWAFSADDATNSINGVGGAAGAAAEQARSFADELAREDEEDFKSIQAAIANAQVSLNEATNEALKFGEAGFDAAYQFQQSLAELQRQAEAGILNETAYQQEVDKATEAYRSQIDTIKEAAAEEERKAEAARRSAEAAIEADKKRADSFIASQRLGGEDKATKAAEDLLAITRQIDEAEVAIAEARAANDSAAEAAALRRFRVLEQAEAKAQEVLQFGFSSEDARKAIEEVERSFQDDLSFDNFVIAPDAFREAQSQLDELKSQLEQNLIDPDQFRVAADDVRRGFEDAFKKAQEINQLNEKYAEKAADIEADRLDALSRQSNEALTGNDLRTSAGAAQFIALATGREDPAVEEYRKQLRELQDIRREIAKANAAPVEIAG